MPDLDLKARIAGLFYLILVITGMIHLIYIPSELIIQDNPVQTIENILNSETMLRIGILIGILSYFVFAALVLALYRLLHQVNENLARIMVLLVLINLPVSFVNMLHKFEVLALLSHVNRSGGAEIVDLKFQVMNSIQAYRNGLSLSKIFWGAWLFPFGLLVFRSGFLPKLLGIFLMLGCLGYLTSFVGHFLYEDFGKTILGGYSTLPASIGEIGICLWLLVMGARTIRLKKG